MSNRNKWAHWNKPKAEKHPLLMKWFGGIGFIVLGCLLLLAGWQGFGDHVLWYKSFDFRFGIPIVHQTLDLIFFGAAFLLAGIGILVIRQ